MSATTLIVSLIASNFLCTFLLGASSYEQAFDRSFFQAVAVMPYVWCNRKPRAEP